MKFYPKTNLILYCLSIWIGSILVTSPLIALLIYYIPDFDAFGEFKNYWGVMFLCLYFSGLLSIFVPILLILWLRMRYIHYRDSFGAIQVLYFSVGLWIIIAMIATIAKYVFYSLIIYSLFYVITANILAFLLIKPFNLHESNQ
jgi:hypothetical protein